jgi:hypothetical protein
MRQRIALVGVVMLAWALLDLNPRSTIAQDSEPDPSSKSRKVNDPEPPLTIAMSNVGRFSEGYSWYLSVNAAGQASLRIETFPEQTQREFVVPPTQLAVLRAALRDQRFFELGEAYGAQVPCGSTKTLTVTAGNESRSVKWYAVGSEDTNVREACRALRVGMVIRNWFNDSDAVDLRKYEQLSLGACK